MGALGFGAAPIGNLYRPLSEARALDAVAAALDGGIRYFDTAPYYGFGLSEKRLGAALVNRERDEPIGHGRNRVIVSTKVGRCLNPVGQPASGTRYGFVSDEPMEPYFDYSYDGVMRAFESSQRRLQTEHIDILLAHDLGQVTHGAAHAEKMREFLDSGYRAMEYLKQQGLVRALGAGANEWQVGLALLANTDIDCFLLAGRYTLLDQSAGAEFFPACARRDVSVILGGPFNSGILATGTAQKKEGMNLNYDYLPASRDIVERVARIEAQCEQFHVELAAAALQFPLANPVVCTVLAGFAGRDEVESAISAMNQKVPAEFWHALQGTRLIAEHVEIPQAR